MDSDVVMKKPDMVVIYIGVNDVWHKTTSGTGTDPNKFEKFYEAIIRKLQSHGTQVILCTPAAIGEKKDNVNQQDGDLNAYSQMIRDLAKKYNCSLVDLRKAFMDYQINHNPENKEKDILTRDRVHLNDAGSKMVAELLFPLLIK
jgi:lysophospholipase L1-like esterase